MQEMECAAECDGLCPLCLAEELRRWKAAAAPRATTPEGLTDELQRLEIALRSAADCINSNKRHLETDGRNCTIGTHQVLYEIANALVPPNKQAERPE